MIRGEKKDVVVTHSLIHIKQFNEFKTHILKHIDMIRGKKRDMWWLLIAYNTQNNSMMIQNSPPKAERQDRRRDMRCVVVIQNYIYTNTSRKVIYLLKQKHDTKKEMW